MARSQVEKAETHRRIVEVASRRFREKGIDGIGVADVMKEAGLTVGGFYKHFASRDELVREALGEAYGGWSALVAEGERAGQPVSFADIAGDYLSERHRQGKGGGCPFAALAPDIARCDEKTRGEATAELERAIEVLTDVRGGKGDDASRRRAAIVAYATLVGAMTLARIPEGGALGEEILSAARETLLGPDGKAEGRGRPSA
ncbi:TetR/AcrR family transcriptional regulator [Aurantimonas sp. MSK8Z-1]|uniref:TetR/AcrR family transcriptional regulator n=1 Tax=Mangrovibrevibacter kandeliae TaxID=2968473 RepID=UPI002117A511|nr:TetR/AcrR family transcriptional regulator [Aurantimonas sp. MSK8Z-1]MCW4116805.1 TetR/AcrR family transcriptional regulator [Aurantimonas sp. MSK8Z-1]